MCLCVWPLPDCTSGQVWQRGSHLKGVKFLQVSRAEMGQVAQRGLGSTSHVAQGYSVTCTCEGDTGAHQRKVDAEVSLGFCCLCTCMKESSHEAREEAELVQLFTDLISLKSAGIVFTKFHVLA